MQGEASDADFVLALMAWGGAIFGLALALSAGWRFVAWLDRFKCPLCGEHYFGRRASDYHFETQHPEVAMSLKRFTSTLRKYGMDSRR